MTSTGDTRLLLGANCSPVIILEIAIYTKITLHDDNDNNDKTNNIVTIIITITMIIITIIVRVIIIRLIVKTTVKL